MKFVAAVLSLVLLAGCSSQAEQTSTFCPETATRLSEVQINLRVASLALGAASVVASLGAESALVGQDLGSNLDLPVLNPAHEIDLEGLLELNPDLVFADAAEPDDAALEAIEKSGIRVITLESTSSLQDSYQRILEIAAALKIAPQGEQLVEAIERDLATLPSEAFADQKIAFLYLRGNAGIYLIGGAGSGADALIERLGAIDVGTELGVSGFAPISAEALLEQNPDYLLVMEKGLQSVGGIDGLVQLPGIAGTRAGLERRVLVGADADLLTFGPQTPAVLKCLMGQS